ncbi:hypothetical protein OG218_01570 [Kineococcus sp. NBC_00420]|uniref:hypothetical protein n=1 Tax=Kineococcus sp. NBC_00420 TaxID=2903564 RepID=UPI002E248BD3
MHRLQVNDLLPDDIATDLQAHGITVILVGVDDRGDGVVERWWQQPHILLDLLLARRLA